MTKIKQHELYRLTRILDSAAVVLLCLLAALLAWGVIGALGWEP